MAYTNTTSISGPGGSNPFGQISSALAPIYSMFGSPSSSSGGGTGVVGGGSIAGAGGSPSGSNPFGITTMNPNDPNNVMLYANLANIMGVGGANLLSGGSNLINQGTGVVGGGLGTEAAALSMLQQPYNFESAVASGDPSAMTSVAAPLANTLATQSNVAGTMADASTPAGGYRSVVAAGRPQTLASTIGQSELGYQQQAMQNLLGIANEAAGIGSNIAGTGLGLQGTGTTLTGQGGQMMQNAAADALQKTQLNYQFGGPQTFATIAGGIGSILGGLFGSGGSGLKLPSCWIAQAIYGPDDMRWRWCRAYLNGPFCDSVFGRIVMWFYRRFGERIAPQVKKRKWLKRGLKPLFDMALGRALTFNA